MGTYLSSAKRINHLILIGQISVMFGLFILALRHFWVFPALHFPATALTLLIGFIPSLLHRFLPARMAPYLLVGNALLLVSLVFSLLQEWALSGVFILVPVYSLLFQDRKIYMIASAGALVLSMGLALLFLYDQEHSNLQIVMLMDILTVFMIVVFLIYFTVKDLRWQYMAEAKHLQTILALSQSVEAKDPYTMGHSERVAALAERIALRIPELDTKTVHNAGLVHDVGKLSIPDAVLLKKSQLTDEEYAVMKSHTTVGAKLCRNLDISEEIIQGVLHHHERWDGKGYPHRLQGNDIPLIGRVLGIADAIDAMCSNRAYRNALLMDVVYAEIEKNSGRQFDPAVARIVLERWDEVGEFYQSQELPAPALPELA